MTDETTNPNRWTAEVHMAAGTNGREYAAWLYDGGRYIGKPVHGMEKDCNAFAKQINRPAPTAPADDDLYLCLHGAREALCLAQMQVPAYLSERIGKILRRIDAIGTDRLPQWSTFDRDHELPESAPTAPADDLPPGVERISDGTLWIRLDPDRTEKVLPDDYEWLSDTAVEMDEPVMVQVRPITPAEPATEWVPWWEALNAELPLVEWGGRVIKNAQRQHSGVLLSTWGLFPVIRVDADGRVEVQR